jgi:hypothetical protein
MGGDLPLGIDPLLIPYPAIETKTIGPTFFLGYCNGFILRVSMIGYGATSPANGLPDDDRLLLKIPIALMNPLRDLHLAPPMS